MGSLKIEKLTKRFGEDSGKIVAVDDLDIEIKDGEFLVLVGPSGCGKSTTLRSIAGLEQISEGEIYIAGEPTSDKKPKNRDIAMVFQNYALYPHMTARENMAFGLKMTTDLSKDEVDERVQRVARQMGISELLESKPSELSGGQQQRVALGRAIVRDPEVFLMDEPLSNLDAKLRSHMRTELQDLHQELGVTTIYVTHDQTEAMTMGDRIAILNDGQLQQIGTPLECYHDPVNRFVASFIGSPSMNFFDIAFTGQALEHDEFIYELSDELISTLRDAPEDLVLGIRPEDIEIVDSSDVNAISTEISVVEPMGDLTHIYFELGGETYPATVGGDMLIRPGDEIEITFADEKIHLFDAKTEEAIDLGREVPQHMDTFAQTSARS